MTEARTALIKTLIAPSGVTNIAGANAYAAKLAASPTTIVNRPAHHIHSFKYAKPPSPARDDEVDEATFNKPFFLTIKLVPINTHEL